MRLLVVMLMFVPPAPAAALPGAHENSLGMKFVPVPGTAVLFSVYETRVQDFEAFVKATDYRVEPKLHTWIKGEGKVFEDYSWRSPGFPQGPTHPVGGVSWNDAQAFCRWLTARERAAGKITSRQRYRLPTDREWSVAVGLGEEPGTTPAERAGKIKNVHPWGTHWPPPAHAGNYGDASWTNPTDLREHNDGHAFTAPVGSFTPNVHGLYDLGGNVYEWCEDLEYAKGDNHRVMRGSAFNSRIRSMVQSSTRIHFEPDNRAANHGFRCVLEIQ